MKLHLPVSLRSALFVCLGLGSFQMPTAQAAAYLAEGVNVANVSSSERFFDDGKGYYWSNGFQPNPLDPFSWEGEVYQQAQEIYAQTTSLSFLGDLAEHVIPETGRLTAASFEFLVDDDEMCWAYSGANVIQYWLGYYGVFAKDKELMPYGYTYDKKYVSQLAGTQSLKASQFLYFQDNRASARRGGRLINATYYILAEWHEETQTDDGYLEVGGGGFFEDVITSSEQIRGSIDVSDLDSLKTALVTGMGFSEDGQLDTKGQIVTLNIQSDMGGGHALTCYGFETDGSGVVRKLYIANSDDVRYGIETVYVRMDGARVYLYTDPACQNEWLYNGQSRFIFAVDYIKTPEILKDMLVQYEANNLVWNGKKADNTWTSRDGIDAGALPTDATGWNVNINDKSYNSYYASGRSVEFTDAGVSADTLSAGVTVSGTVTVPEMILGASAGRSYNFKGTNRGGITAERILFTGAGQTQFADLKMTVTDAITVGNTSTLTLRGTTLKAPSLTITSGSTLALSGSNTLTASLVLEEGSMLNLKLGGTSLLGKTKNPLVINGNVHIALNSGWFSGVYTLGTFSSVEGDLNSLIIDELSIEDYAWRLEKGALKLYVGGSNGEEPIPDGELESDIWQDSVNDFENAAFQEVTLGEDSKDHTIIINGLVSPSSVTVKGSGTTTWNMGDFGGKVSGRAALIKEDAGTLVINLDNSYSGGTTIHGGTVVANSSKALGSGEVSVHSGATLDFGELKSAVVTNKVHLAESATLMNASAVMRVGLGVGDEFYGNVTMPGYRLGQGQTLSTARFGNATVQGSGIVLAGGTIFLNGAGLTFADTVTVEENTITTLNVAGMQSVVQQATGLTSPLARSAAPLVLLTFNNDVKGVSADKPGFVVEGLENGSNGRLTLLEGEGLTKVLVWLSLQGDEPEDPDFNEPTREPHDVDYKVSPASLDRNQREVYKSLVVGDARCRYDGELAELAEQVYKTGDKKALQNVLDNVDGSVYTTQMNAQIDGNLAHLRALRDVMGYGKESLKSSGDYRFAAQATGSFNRMDGKDGAPGYDRSGWGGLVAMERHLSDAAVVGLSVDYEHARVQPEGRHHKWESNDTHVGMHLLLRSGELQSRTIASVGLHEYDFTRSLDLGGKSLLAESSPEGVSFNFMEEVSYYMALGETSSLEPFFRIESSFNKIDAVDEAGTMGNATLAIAGQKAWATDLTLGVRFVHQFSLGGLLRPSRYVLEAGLSKGVGDCGEPLDVHFVGAPADGFHLTGATRGRWGGMLGASLIIPVDDAQMINLGAKAHLNGENTEVNANAGYQIVF